MKTIINNLFSLREYFKNGNSFRKKHIFIDDTAVYDNKSSFGSPVKIGRHSYIYQSSILDYSYLAGYNTIMNTQIGKFCSIAENVVICLGKHPTNKFASTSPAFYSIHKQCGVSFVDKQYFDEMGSVSIGNDVWVGAKSIILDDVSIGNGAIIAANSVVTTNVPPYAIYGGTPAKFLKFRFTDLEIEFLENFKWWEKDKTWFENNYHYMHDVGSLIKRFS